MSLESLRRAPLAAAFLAALSIGVRAQDPPPTPAPATPAVQEPAPTQLSEQERERLTDVASQAAATQIASEDAAISERLRSILAAVDAFAGILVEVSAGVVLLTGEATSREMVDKAAEVAGKLDGVLLVINQIELQKDLGRRIDSTWDVVWTRAREAFSNLPILGVALLVFAGFFLLARMLRNAQWPYRLLARRVLLQDLLRQSVFVFVLLAGLVAILSLLDATAVIGTLLGAAGVVGLALGFAFRNIVENYLAGILLAIRQPFHARDFVAIDGSQGTVLRMTSSETTLLDADGNHVRLPNAAVFNGVVVNYTRNPLRRFTVAVGVANDVDLIAAQQLGVTILERMNGVVDEPRPSSRVAALGDSNVGLEFFGWIDQRNANYMKVASEAHRLLKAAFDDAGVDMPAPSYNIVLDGRAPADVVAADRPGRAAAPPPRQSGPAPEQIEVGTEDDIKTQVEQELAQSDEPDLLREGEAVQRPDA